jgi:uncharacterized membrane protein YciS (DUF1049 family)
MKNKKVLTLIALLAVLAYQLHPLVAISFSNGLHIAVRLSEYVKFTPLF